MKVFLVISPNLRASHGIVGLNDGADVGHKANTFIGYSQIVLDIGLDVPIKVAGTNVQVGHISNLDDVSTVNRTVDKKETDVNV